MSRLPDYRRSTAASIPPPHGQPLALNIDERAAVIARLNAIEFELIEIPRRDVSLRDDAKARARLRDEWAILVGKLGLTKE